MKELTYKRSGVDINKASSFIEFIKRSNKKNKNVISGIGGFASLFSLEGFQYKSPVIVSSTDGVGTKILVADDVSYYDSIGIDLVAMCVNDLICHGANPLFFLDYYASGKLNMEIAKKILLSIIDGCKIANIPLVGGETAELPDTYQGNCCDLAGFAVGIAEKDAILPSEEIKASDVLLGFKSSGIHSNGFSLIRKLFHQLKIKYSDVSPWGGKKWYEILLEPTRIYIDDIREIKEFSKGFAHITGGGIFENIKRIIPENTSMNLTYSEDDWPELFKWIKNEGKIAKNEILKTFNCGIGMVAVLADHHAVHASKSSGAEIIGSLQ